MSGADVLAAEQRLVEAVLSRDQAGADAVLATDFAAIGHSGNGVDRATYLAIHFAPERNFTVFDTHEQVVTMIGTSALVTGKVTMVNANLPKNPPPARYSALYVPDAVGWRLRFWQETPITPDDF